MKKSLGMGCWAAVLAMSSAAATRSQTVTYDIDLVECPECPNHEWEVLQGNPEDEPPRELIEKLTDPNGTSRHAVDNGIERPYQVGEGPTYSETVYFSGYSSTQLCSKDNRTEHLNGHTECPLIKDWYPMWKPAAAALAKIECWIDDMVPEQVGSKLNNPKGTTTLLGKCPAAGTDPDPTYKGGQYDWRYGGIRPQDNPDSSLYPSIAKHIEEKVEATGLKVLIKGYSGGTINSYAFLMSQTVAWRQKHVRAYIAWAPVFGGTIESVNSVIYGWQVGGGDAGRCLGRSVAIRLPSVLWMWPHPGTGFGEWNKTEVLVQTPARNYTAYDLDRMLTDAGLDKTKALYDLEKNDRLGKFEPPMVDTYVYYGYGTATVAGYKLSHNMTADKYGPDVCPPTDGHTSLKRTWDDGDKTAPRRSVSRADAWTEAHKRGGFVLKNYGYKGQGHSSSCKVPECKPDYDCMMAVLDGKPLPPGCK